jgi:hypothetical protein
MNVEAQFTATVGDFWGKAALIDGPNGLEILRAVVADCELHPIILDAGHSCAWKSKCIKHLRPPGKFKKIYVEGLAQ